MRAFFSLLLIGLLLFVGWRVLWWPMEQRLNWAETALLQCGKDAKRLQLLVEEVRQRHQQDSEQQDHRSLERSHLEGEQDWFELQKQQLQQSLLTQLEQGQVQWFDQQDEVWLQLNQWRIPSGKWSPTHPQVRWLLQLCQQMRELGWAVKQLEWQFPFTAALPEQGMAQCWQRSLQVLDWLGQEPPPHLIWRAHTQHAGGQPASGSCPGYLVLHLAHTPMSAAPAK